MIKTPKISVVMSVYNGEKWLNEAIDSILNQTFKDFEFIIINDGSNDRTYEILNSYNDKRLRIINHKSNRGLITRLNEGLDQSNGKYVARMDADDISLPERFKIQIDFLESNPDIGICGTSLNVFYSSSKKDNWMPPTDHDSIMCKMLFVNVIYHPTVMMRSSLLNEYSLQYDKNMKHVEDYDFWVRCGEKFKLTNINNVLVKRRMHNNRIGIIYKKLQLEGSNQIRINQLKKLNIIPSKSEVITHQRIAINQQNLEKSQLVSCRDWINKLHSSNNDTMIYPFDKFSKTLCDMWSDLCFSSTRFGIWSLQLFFSAGFIKYKYLNVKRTVGFFIRCLYPKNNYNN